tara:strand:- start:491 stop:721 length:231 start_codon:yes stop_codon:yes gene_type:complete
MDIRSISETNRTNVENKVYELKRAQEKLSLLKIKIEQNTTKFKPLKDELENLNLEINLDGISNLIDDFEKILYSFK